MAARRKDHLKPRPPPTQPARIYEATLEPGPSGLVVCGAELDLEGAIDRRRAGGDVVVCGDDTKANAQLAKTIELAIGPYLLAAPHRRAGPHALPHCQPDPRPPAGHTFYETENPKMKARKRT